MSQRERESEREKERQTDRQIEKETDMVSEKTRDIKEILGIFFEDFLNIHRIFWNSKVASNISLTPSVPHMLPSSLFISVTVEACFCWTFLVHMKILSNPTNPNYII